MLRKLSFAVAGLIVMAAPLAAHAGVWIGVGIPVPYYHYHPHYYYGPRVYIAPAPVVVQPAPVYVQPAPVYVQPAPQVIQVPATQPAYPVAPVVGPSR